MRKWRHKGGFTLAECMVATVILGIGIVGVAGMFACATISERKATHMGRARQIAEKTLDEVRAGGHGVFGQASGATEVATPGLPRSTGTVAWQPYPDPSSDQGLKLVSLNITWDWAGASAGTYRVATLLRQ